MLKKLNKQIKKLETVFSLTHEKIIKLCLNWPVLNRGMLKGRAHLSDQQFLVVQVVTYKGGDCCHLHLYQKVSHIFRHIGWLIP